jgi:4-hydroxyphenylpyruvate dioxygenase-like putative hemolysin
MRNNNQRKNQLSKIDHIGLVFKDLDKAIECFSSLGIGPFEPPNFAPMVEKRFRGIPGNWKLKILKTKIGDIELEAFQPISGESPQKEFLDRTGGGLHHVGFVVENLDNTMKELLKKGAKILSDGTSATGGGFAYLAFDMLPDFIIELYQY